MSDTDQLDKELEAFLATVKPGEASAEHEAWLTAQIEKTLAKKASGQTIYHDLDEVMRKFGLMHARFTDDAVADLSSI